MLINTNRIHYRPDGSSGNSFVSPKNLGAHDETLTVQSKEGYYPSDGYRGNDLEISKSSLVPEIQ
jgi:hypothetical protein